MTANNAHVGHALLVLTSAYQLIPIDLSSPLPLPAVDEPQVTSASLPPTYISTVSQSEYAPPSLANFTRQRVPRDSANRLMTTDNLRNFGRSADLTQTKSHQLTNDLKPMVQRTALQRKELVRQVEMLHTLRDKMEALRSGGDEILQVRLKRVADTQKRLTDRVEHVLQRCLNSSSTALSDVEVEWFKELAELNNKVAIQGAGNSLQERAEMVGCPGLVLYQANT